MPELIATIFLLSGFIGMGIIIVRKISILKELPEIIEEPLANNFWLKLKEKIKNTPCLKSFSFEVYLQKMLSKIRVLFLKADNKTFNWLQKLKKRSQKVKIKEKDDSYWKEIKKSTKNKQ